MNPELERRLRHFGATVDAAADAAATPRRGPAGSAALCRPRQRRRPDLDRPHRFYRVLAVAAAAVAIVAGGIDIAALDRTSSTPGVADQPIGSTGPAATEPSDAATTDPADIVGPLHSDAAHDDRARVLPAGRRRPDPDHAAGVFVVHACTNDYHLDICDSGPAVRLVQERLRAGRRLLAQRRRLLRPRHAHRGAHVPADARLTVDGQVGPATWAAARARRAGIDSDGNGIVDPDEISTD